MNKAQLQKSFDGLPKNVKQENKRMQYVELCVELYKAYQNKQISESEVANLAKDLLKRNPDPKDTMLQNIDGFLEDLTLDAQYFAGDNIDLIKTYIDQIQIGVRNAQAPSIVCYYLKQNGDAVIATHSVTIYTDGLTISVLDAKNMVSDKLKELFEGKDYSLKNVKALLPNKIGDFSLLNTEDNVLSFCIKDFKG